MLSIGMLDARMWIHDNIDPHRAIEVYKWSVTIAVCSYPYTEKSKELDYVRKSAHEVISGSKVIHNNIEPISMVNTITATMEMGTFHLWVAIE